MSTKASGILNLFNPQKEYSSLNLSDLLLARELNHYELMQRPNVVATAVGYYLIRKADPWPTDKTPKVTTTAVKPARTLGNSEVRTYSWPCILVFVDKWVQPDALKHNDMVPSALYLDGHRKVPICVVYAPRVDSGNEPVRNIAWPASRLGGGFPLLAKVQGKEHIASVGCLVSDGHSTYALTNRHVAGDVGEGVYAILNGVEIEIGVTDSKQLSTASFETVYPGFRADHLRLNMDIGLIRLNDINHWSAQVFGFPSLGPMVDLGAEDPLLNLIDCPVTAFGAASGKVQGAIKALFYRYDKKRDNEYVSDYLIGPCSEAAEGTFFTQHGDSGTLWMVEAATGDLRPIAVQWGGHVFSESGSQTVTPYALATSLATVCDLLEVDVVRDWNIGTTDYWGEMGHYSIGAKAAALSFEDANGNGLGLQTLMNANIDRVGFDDATLSDSELFSRNKAHYNFVPLADVADDVWRNSRPQYSNNHFADMDAKATSGKYRNKTLLDLCLDANDDLVTDHIDPEVWLDYFIGVPGAKPGALPFRVWQMYDEMVECLKSKDVLGFLVGAGCMAHYVGDASQPLHISVLNHNDPDSSPVRKKVHSVYETDMLNAHAPDIVAGMTQRLAGATAQPISGFEELPGGKRAACHVVSLMVKTLTNGSTPRTDSDQGNLARQICDTYNAAAGPADRVNQLWENYANLTMDRMAACSLCLGEIWASAWVEGDGENNIPASDLVQADTKALSAIYKDPNRYKSMELSKMADLLAGTVAG